MATMVTSNTDKERRTVAKALRQLADKIEKLKTLESIRLTWDWPAVEVTPEPGDQYRRYRHCADETIVVHIRHNGTQQ